MMCTQVLPALMYGSHNIMSYCSPKQPVIEAQVWRALFKVCTGLCAGGMLVQLGEDAHAHDDRAECHAVLVQVWACDPR